LLEPLEKKLIALLKSLDENDWQKPTLAKRWTVKDVAAHLLDGQIRTLAIAKNYVGDPPMIESYSDLVNYLNRLNADWVQAMKRVSPDTLIKLLEATQNDFIHYYHSIDPWAPARFAVSWAGQSTSFHWFHTAREFTERWHHQQQIREAVHKPGLMEKEFLSPLLHTFMTALPHTYRNVKAAHGQIISVMIPGEAGGDWKIRFEGTEWVFIISDQKPDALIMLEVADAWKLFTNAYTREEARKKVKISGQAHLGEPFLQMRSVMV
jgi:uncharacterized protein (TIGR03083 family)